MFVSYTFEVFLAHDNRGDPLSATINQSAIWDISTEHPKQGFGINYTNKSVGFADRKSRSPPRLTGLIINSFYNKWRVLQPEGAPVFIARGAFTKSFLRNLSRKTCNFFWSSGCHGGKTRRNYYSQIQSQKELMTWMWQSIMQLKETCKLKNSAVNTCFIKFRSKATLPSLYSRPFPKESTWIVSSQSHLLSQQLWVADDENKNPRLHSGTSYKSPFPIVVSAVWLPNHPPVFLQIPPLLSWQDALISPFPNGTSTKIMPTPKQPSGQLMEIVAKSLITSGIWISIKTKSNSSPYFSYFFFFFYTFCTAVTASKPQFTILTVAPFRKSIEDATLLFTMLLSIWVEFTKQCALALWQWRRAG